MHTHVDKFRLYATMGIDSVCHEEIPMPPPRSCPDGEKYCPDCGRCRPLDVFYKTAAARYTGGVRYSAYCTEHQDARNVRAEKQREARDPAAVEARRARQRAYQQRKAAQQGTPRTPRPELSLRAAAALIGVSHQYVAALQKSGTLPTPLTRAAVEAFAVTHAAADRAETPADDQADDQKA